jgi:RNA-binding protein YlmH
MTQDEQLLKNRFAELARRAFIRESYAYSEFLTLAEQDVLTKMAFAPGLAPFALEGGYPAAERKVACFGDERKNGYAQEPPIVCVAVSPVHQKFADTLTHRDFLGALMALGFRRSVLGDIVVSENCGYVFCLESVAGYVAEQFTQVRRTTVRCAVTQAPDLAAELPEPVSLAVASERADAVVAAVYKLSRNESQQLISQEKVFVNSRQIESPGFVLPPGGLVSVRGFGRFLYEGVAGETRRGRLRVSIRIF